MAIKTSEKNILYGASVIICCYNSEDRIVETLLHLSKQLIPGDFFIEIILVNNASTDNTIGVAAQIWNNITLKNIELVIINEPGPGQMFARKTGVKKAFYETIVFCDDDNWLEENYIFTAYSTMQKDVMIGAAGGKNLPVTNAEAYPEWFNEYKDKYGTGIPADTSGEVSYKGFVLGAGLITRKTLFMQVFDDRYPSILNGRNGAKLSTGDDFEYCKRLLLWDYKLFYNSDLTLQHFIPKERLTLDYREKLLRGINEAGRILYEYDLAIRVYKKNKNKNKWRLLLLSPFRILLATAGFSKRDVINERLTLFYLLPFQIGNEPVKAMIKKFIQHK